MCDHRPCQGGLSQGPGSPEMIEPVSRVIPIPKPPASILDECQENSFSDQLIVLLLELLLPNYDPMLRLQSNKFLL